MHATSDPYLEPEFRSTNLESVGFGQEARPSVMLEPSGAADETG